MARKQFVPPLRPLVGYYDKEGRRYIVRSVSADGTSHLVDDDGNSWHAYMDGVFTSRSPLDIATRKIVEEIVVGPKPLSVLVPDSCVAAALALKVEQLVADGWAFHPPIMPYSDSNGSPMFMATLTKEKQ